MRVTHGERVIDTSTGITKMELVKYFACAAPWAIKHVQGRPMFVRRVPASVQAGSIFQEHTLDMRGLKAADRPLWPGHEPAIAMNTTHDIVVAAQFDVFELHTWNSTAAAITQPDRMVFDLDPGKGFSWADMKKAVLLVKALLAELGLKSWVKTSGGKGLHVFVPLKPEADYPTVKAFSQAVAVHLAKTLPQIFVAIAGERARVGRVFIDYLRNGWVQTTAEAFSVRARPGLGVAMPITWEELDEIDGPDHWNVRSAMDRINAWKQHPWAAYWKSAQSLEQAMKRLDFVPPSIARHPSGGR